MPIEKKRLQIYRLCALLFCFSVFSLPAIFLFSTSYQDFSYYLLKETGKLHKLDEFQSGFLTIQKFWVIRIISIFVPILTTLSVFVLSHFYSAISQYVKGIFGDILRKLLIVKEKFDGLSWTEKSAFLVYVIGLIAVRFYYALTMPVSYDEAWTYFNFSEKGILTSLSYYPAPNNHILFSILTNISFWFPFDATTNLRIPSILIGIVACLIFATIVFRYFGFKASLVGSAVFTFLPVSTYYGYMARGYGLTLLAFVIGLYATLKIMSDSENRLNWFAWIVSSVLGFYSIPIYLFPFVSLTLLLFINIIWQANYKRFLELFLSGSIVTTIVIILYTPIFFISGIGSVTSNKFVIVHDRVEMSGSLFFYFQKTFDYFIGIPYGWLILSVATLLAVFFYTTRKLGLVVLYLFLIPFILLFIHSVATGERTWFYQITTISLLVVIIICAVKKQVWFSNQVAYLFLILIFSYGILTFSYQVRHIEGLDIEAHKLFLEMQNHKINSFYINDDLIDMPIEYYFEINKIPYQIHRAHIQGELDISQSKFQYYILKKDSYDVTKFAKFNLIIENGFFDVYEFTRN